MTRALGYSLLIFHLFLLGCASLPPGTPIRDVNQSLGNIRAAIAKSIGEARRVSQNQREYQSRYFSRKPDKSFDPNKSAERAYAHISILGDRRPYTIVVAIKVERFREGRYEEIGLDEGIARKMAQDIHGDLVKSKDGRVIIDDFRPF